MGGEIGKASLTESTNAGPGTWSQKCLT